MKDDGGAWTGFLVTAFGVLGLVGAFAIFAAQIPIERAASRDAALAQVLGASPAQRDSLRPLLGESARVLDGPADGLAARVTEARLQLLPEAVREAEDIGFRLRIVLAVFTGAAALFGVAVLSVVRRARPAS